jgi:hypothetical protein
MAVLGGDFDLLVDHGAFFIAAGFAVSWSVAYDCKETGT